MKNLSRIILTVVLTASISMQAAPSGLSGDDSTPPAVAPVAANATARPAATSRLAGLNKWVSSARTNASQFSGLVSVKALQLKKDAGERFDATKNYVAATKCVYVPMLMVLGALGWEGIRKAYAAVTNKITAPKKN